MSRSGYTDGCEDQWASIRWRGAVKSAIKGRRGQAFLRELLAALDAMPEKALTTNALAADGEFCTLGVLGHQRGMNLEEIDPEDCEAVAKSFGISQALAREIVYENDEHINTEMRVEVFGPPVSRYSLGMSVCVYVPRPGWQEELWGRMRHWVAAQVRPQDVVAKGLRSDAK